MEFQFGIGFQRRRFCRSVEAWGTASPVDGISDERRKKMFLIELNRIEAEMLYGILGDCLSELRMEVAHTDDRDYRKTLLEQESLIKKILRRLDEEGVKAPPEPAVS